MTILIKQSSAKQIILTCTVVLAFAFAAMAQSVGSSRGLSTGEGTNTIEGRVYFPASEENKGKGVKLHLESDNQVAGQTAVTDHDGTFRFNSLVPGNYTVVVDGKEYENTREPVSIERANGRTVQVNIQLRPKIDANNAAFAGVPKAALEAYQKAVAATQKNDSKAAMQFLTEAVAAKPDFALALNDLGTLYEKQFQWSKAAETFAALVKVTPKDASAQTSLGIALYNQGVELTSQQKFEEAETKFNACEAALRESIKLKSPAPVPHYYIGLMLIKFKLYDEAQKELEASIKDAGGNMPLAHKILGGLYISTKKNKEAADELETYLKLEPKAADAEKIKKTISDLRKQ